MLDRRWKLLAEIAGTQFGVVTIEQLLSCGFSPQGINRAAATGQLFRIHAGVYSVGFRPTDANAHWLAAVLACGPSAAISHRSACEAIGILRLRPGPVDVSIVGRSGRDRARVRIHRPRCLPPDEITRVRTIPCTTASRSILDVAASRPRRELEWAIEASEGLNVLDVAEIDRLLDRYPGRRGAPRVRALLGLHDGVPLFTRSGLERRMYRLCRWGDIELPQMNVNLRAGAEEYEVDCLWARERLIVECDSHRWHDNPVAANRDALRDEALTQAGWRVHRLRWIQIVERPAETARTVRMLLEQQRGILGLPASASGPNLRR